MKDVKALREVSREEVMDLVQNGMRELFDLGTFKVIDGTKGEEQSHFVYDMGTHRCFLVSKENCYDLVTAFFCGGDKQALLGNLRGIVASV